MRWRTPALVGGWALAVVVATGVGWAGVNLVADEVSPSGSSALSQAEVERRIHAAGASASASTNSSASASTSSSANSSVSPSGDASPAASAPATPVRRSATARGGSVVLECTGSQITAKSSPRPGYTVSEDARTSGTEVLVVFSNGSASSQVQGRCADGVPVSSVHETQGSGGSGSGDD